ncbi:efflux RND transporter permease subunit [Desulfoscipio gibsoniae]
MILADVSIKRPVFTVVIMIMFLVLGIFCYTYLPINENPQVEFPYVTVTVTQAGASPEQLETNVTKKVEEAVGQISGVNHISSTMSEGFSNTIIEFTLDKSSDVAAQEVRDKIAAIRGELPQDINDPVIAKLDVFASSILSIAVTGTEEIKDLSEFVDDKMVKSLYQVKGVGAVNIHGNTKREIQIKLDQNKMASYGLMVGEVVGNFQNGNLEGTGGRVSNENNEISLQLDGSVKKAEDFNNILVAERNGVDIRVQDIAEVIDGVQEVDSLSRYQGKPAIGIDIVKQSGANTVEVADEVKRTLSDINASLPAGINVNLVRDNSEQIRDSVNGVQKNLLEGCILAILIVFFFLHDWKSTLISAVSLTISIISAFIAMKVMNFSLNHMSLMALTLSIGLLIDDAIIVVENIVRHIRLGKPPLLAAKEATSEIGPAVLATTLAVVAVFLPTAMVSGLVGRYFIEFGLTVAFSMLFSLFISFTLVPMMVSKLLKTREKRETLYGGFSHGFNYRFNQITEKYSQLLKVALSHRLIVIIMTITLFVGSIGLLSVLGFELDISSDTSDISIAVGLDSGLPLEKAGQKAESLEEIIRGYTEVESIYTTVQKDRISCYVKLCDKKERKDSTKTVADKMREDLKKIPGVELAVRANIHEADESKEVAISIKGDNYDQLRTFALEAKRTMNQDSTARDVSISYKAGKPEARLVIDRDKAADLGVDTASALNTLNTLLGGTVISHYDSAQDKVDVRISMKDEQRTSLDSLNGVYVPGSGNQMIPLSQVTSQVFGTTASTLNRYDRSGQIELSANVVGMPTEEFLNTYLAKLKQQAPQGITIEVGGMSAELQEGFIGLLIALGMGVLFIFLIMAAQFESFIDPLAIMASLPLALIGAIAGLFVTSSKMNFMALIGIIFLMGLVAKNAILLIDFTKQRLREGVEINQALIEAGLVRFRPIIMTTLAMIFGMIPVAMSTGPGTEMRAPMAYAVIGGLITSTLLSLVIVPIVYTLLNDFKRLFGRKKMFVETGEDVKFVK